MSESLNHDAIYLQLCDDEDSEWCDTVTWCHERVHEADVKYVRADLVESLHQQLADCQKREVMLRDVIQHILSGSLSLPRFARDEADEALAATADLSKYVLCDAEPVGYVDESDDGKWGDLVPDIDIKLRAPLYRAWEPKP